ncbi:MAG: hypothetical protein WD793_05640 [Steroidobacteraceae bacterium]
MPSAFENLCGPGRPLKAEPPDEAEITGLLRSAQARLTDAAREDLSLDSRFDLAYGAAHALPVAALRRCGYRATQRYIVFQLLPHTLRLGPEVWRVLSRCHELRNLAEYEGELRVTPELLEELMAICRKLDEALNESA